MNVTCNNIFMPHFPMNRETIAYVIDMGQEKRPIEDIVPKKPKTEAPLENKSVGQLATELAESKVMSW